MQMEAFHVPDHLVITFISFLRLIFYLFVWEARGIETWTKASEMEIIQGSVMMREKKSQLNAIVYSLP